MKKLVSLSSLPYEEGLTVADVASGAVTPLTPSGRYPRWSPDGRTIAFIDRERLWAVPAAGGAPRRLGNRKIDEQAAPSWSPDSQRLAYMAAFVPMRTVLRGFE